MNFTDGIRIITKSNVSKKMYYEIVLIHRMVLYYCSREHRTKNMTYAQGYT